MIGIIEEVRMGRAEIGAQKPTVTPEKSRGKQNDSDLDSKINWDRRGSEDGKS